MAYRKYIGARYVPLYAGIWDSTKNYEPLTIVDDNNGNSYTSRKDVPAGTPLSDREYWIQTSSFSGAITQLQNRMNDAEEAIAADELRIEGLEEWRQSVEENKSAIFMSDSYGAGLNYFDRVGNFLGYDQNHRFIFDLGGYGFVGVQGAWLTYLQEHLADITADFNDIDLIVVAGGLNDVYQSQADIETAISNFCAFCRTTFPNAKIKIGMISVNFNITTDANHLRYANLYANVLPAYKNCARYFAEYLDGVEWIFYNRARLQGERLDHPITSAANSLWCAMHIAKAIATGSTTVIESCAITFTSETGYDTPVTGYGGYMVRTNNKFVIHDRVNFAGIVQIFESTEKERSAYAGLPFSGCMKSNELTVLPPLTHNPSETSGIYATNATVYSGSTSTQKTVTGAVANIDTSISGNFVSLYLFVWGNGAMAGTYKAGIRIVLPVQWTCWQ